MSTSWQPVAGWYSSLVGEKGQYYHQHMVIPGVVRLLGLTNQSRLIDVACGQGVLGRAVSKAMAYTGFDISPALIREASRLDNNPAHRYLTGDATKPFPLAGATFTHAAIVLALQNIEHTESVIAGLAACLEPGGTCVIVLNHPAFRIPRQTSWGIDNEQKMQYRRVNRYLSPLRIPITAHPGEKQSAVTWSFHHPISYYVGLFASHGFVVDAMEEWASDKESVGKAARMENRSRAEIPLFMAVRVRKLS